MMTEQEKLQRDAARWCFTQKKGFCCVKDSDTYKFRIFIKPSVDGFTAWNRCFLAQDSNMGRAIDKAIKAYQKAKAAKRQAGR